MTTVFKVNQPMKTGFNNLFDHLLRDMPASATQSAHLPAANILENNEAFILELNAPGRNKEAFNINCEKNLLTISYNPGEPTNDENVKSIRREFNVNGFSRTFTIDQKLIGDDISAKYENGILTVRLPKKEEVKVTPKKITIE